MCDVVLYETFEEEQKILQNLMPAHIAAQYTWKTIQESGDQVSPAKLISIRTQSQIPFEWAENLDGVLSRSQGFDHLLRFRKSVTKNIPCGYLSSYCSRAVAEHAIMFMLTLFRKTKQQIAKFDTFHRDGLTGRECSAKNVVVVGVGNIGSEIVDMAKGLRMNVKGVDIDPKVDGLEYVSLEAGIPWADVIFCALPLDVSTQGMLGYSCLKKVRKEAIFINISRGEISPIQDIKKLLDNGILGGVGLDVFEDETLLAHSLRSNDISANKNVETILALKDRPNVLFTPHNAFNSQEALYEKARQSVKAVEVFLKTKHFSFMVPTE